jgi:hypothetical protein
MRADAGRKRYVRGEEEKKRGEKGVPDEMVQVVHARVRTTSLFNVRQDELH